MTKRVAIAALTTASLVLLEGRAGEERHSRLLKEAVLHQGERSQSGWLWNRDEPVRDFADSYFRYSFDLPDEPEKAELLMLFDDSGEFLLNGRAMNWDPSTFVVDPVGLRAALRKGRNLLSVKLHNGYSDAGVIFTGQVWTKDGSVVELHSDTSVRAAAKANAGWTKPEYDDSGWKPALWQGHATISPWGPNVRGCAKFILPREVERYEREEESGRCRLPPGIENEPEVDARVVFVGGMPKISVNGTTMDADLSLIGGGNEWTASQLLRFASLGLHFHQVSAHSIDFRKGAGVYDFSGIDRGVRRVLQLDPEARVMLALRFQLDDWCAENPDEAIVYAAGKKGNPDENVGTPRRPSPASLKFRDEVDRIFAALGEYVRGKPWRKRLIAVRPNWGTYNEWHVYGMWNAPDVSKPMAEAFHKWRDGKYAGESLPTAAERVTGKGFILDPSRHRKTIDFFQCQAEQVVDLMHAMARSAKKALPGRLVGFYYGYVLAALAPEGANVLTDRALSSPDVDFLSDPAEYTPECRRAGGAFYHRAIPTMFAKRGKLLFMEEDSRYHHMLSWVPENYACRTPRESHAAMLRNYLNGLFDRSGIQFTDAIRDSGRRPCAFDDDTVLDALGRAKAAFARAQPVSERSGCEVAYVVSARNRFLWDWKDKPGWHPGNDLYVRQTAAMFATGIPFDVLDLQDYLSDENLYKAAVFLNLFALTKSERQQLISLTRRKGTSAIWISAAGSATAQGFSDAAMSELTGIGLTGAAASPKIAAADARASVGPAGSIVKELEGGVRAVVLPYPVKSGAEMASVLEGCGVWRYARPGDYVRRRGDLLMLHTATAGSHEVKIPGAAGTYEELLSGKTLSGPVLTVDSDGPATWLFKGNQTK